jgi:hypothetical protein
MTRVPVLAMLICCGLICCGLLAAGFAYALGYAPGRSEPRAGSSMTVEVPAPLASSDETIGYR